jgi:5-methylthioadenosine/S-adenosylhomocysteine deaminase
MNLLVQNAAYIVCTPEHVERDWDVLVEGNRIAAVGPGLKAPKQATVIDARGCAVIPGLINAHTHLYQNLLKAVPKDLPLEAWCNEVLFPTVAILREKLISGDSRLPYLWSALGSMEMIKGGTTCCHNMGLLSEGVTCAWQDTGLRGVAGTVLTNLALPGNIRLDEDELRNNALMHITQWHKPDDRIQVSLAPSTVFLCDSDLLQWARDQAEQHDLGVQIHIAETADEVRDAEREWGLHPVGWLNQLDMLNDRLSAVHCVHVTQKEIAQLADGGVKVVHCPKSNMKLASGIAPVADMLRSNVAVSLGTDGCASNDLLDMWEEMRAAVFLARVSTGKADALSAADVLRMATIEGARACRVDAGRIEAGRLADMAIVDLGGVHMRPVHDLINTLVFCTRADDVRDTIIDGQVVMQERQVVNVDEASLLLELEEVEAALFAGRESFQFDVDFTLGNGDS